MDNSTRKLTDTRARKIPLEDGRLEIVDIFVSGKLQRSVLTLESLAHCLGIPMSTANGRYARAGLQHLNTPLITPAGRQQRAFDVSLLDDVIAIMKTRGARVEPGANGAKRDTSMVRPQCQPIEPTMHDGRIYFTIRSLSQAFGRSAPATRKILARAGLLSKFVPLPVPGQVGRPSLGISRTHLAELEAVFTKSTAPLDIVGGIAAGDETREAARRIMRADGLEPTQPTPMTALPASDGILDGMDDLLAGAPDTVDMQLPPVSEPATAGDNPASDIWADVEKALQNT